MQFRKTLIAASLALVSVGAANAAINDLLTGDSDLYLVANKVNGGTSYTYTYDTGLNFLNFLPGTGAAASNQTFNLTSDTNWTSFLQQAGGPSGVVWAVYGGDNLGDAGEPGELRMSMTTDKPSTGMIGTTTSNRLSNARVASGLNNTGTFINNTNLLVNHNSAPNGSGLNVGDGGGLNFADFTVGNQATFGASGFTPVFAAANAIDSFARFAMATVAGGGTQAAQIANYSANGAVYADILDANVAKWRLTSNGELTYVAAIPEPSEWAFMLAGLGLVGLIARRRVRV